MIWKRPILDVSTGNMMKILYDRDIREPLFFFLEEVYGKVRFFEEKVIGRSRADVMMVIEHALVGIEIKSDADSYTRLKGQVRDYNRFFDYNYIKFHFIDFQNQNFYQSFSPIELNEELNNEYVKKSFDEKQEMQSKKFDEQKYKDLICNEQIRLANLLFTNYNPFFVTTNENNSSLLNNEMNPNLDRQLMYISRKKKIFEIVKTNKKIGRLKKNSTKKGKHNNLSEDNLIRKIKRKFLENLRIYINNEYRKFFLNKKLHKIKGNNC